MESFFCIYSLRGESMDYIIQFKGGKTKTGSFKNDLYNYINNRITRFFEYDGNNLKFPLLWGEEDIIKIKKFC